MKAVKTKPKKNNSAFFKWLDELTIKRAAQILKIEVSAVRHWRRGCVLPKDEVKLKIMKLTHGVVNPTDMVLDHFKKSNTNRWSRSQ